ncbi:hypothetical protein AC579_3474 [Pseudocercospora musae]|uniref:Uncharacterized protein n=1 Tax=Pseudocercospora musae TaxID=113226 RepID=A0A139IED3_9PEZI|nr:hypothetical protein AC579_3474 [Pseudocercospora musae]
MLDTSVGYSADSTKSDDIVVGLLLIQHANNGRRSEYHQRIREEARAIYYCRNDFDILHGLYDVSVARLFFKQAEGFWDNYKKTEYHLGDISYQTSYTRPKWDKALLWLQAYHSDEVTRYVCSCDGTDGQRGCCRFEKAFEIINCVNHLAWESVKLMLNAYRKAVQNETDTTWY